MKKVMGFFILVCLLIVLGLWIYLHKYATKADVWSWEYNYHMTLPLRVTSMPINTGEIKAFVDKKRDEGLQAFGAIKEDKKAAFNVWLSGQQALLEQKAKEKMEQEAQSRFDNMKEKRFGSGHGFTTRFSKS